ncbi:DgyrCDS6347 [Dimorphilus gyrociliatus]|uniref:DgyrCDS6347 n=1 Tax=Dimorphilus gyrociliatus TaxID=2664684 RepID=A0A7I8VMZ4_9ANNE|nr:DgyrCDS6347 [Dimorphilus gyrociliatus]
MTIIAKCALRKTGQFLCTNLGVNSNLSLVFVPSASASYMRATYGEPFGYQKPFPYEKKKFTMMSEIFDKTIHRFNENTKAILVEGGPGVGKTDFAHKFAKQFDLKVFDSVHDDSLWIDRQSGYDLRILNEFLPPKLAFYTTKMFYENPHPKDQLGCKLQFQMYEEKFRQYCAALQHLLNTGQGVVIVRSVWSDIVYAEAMKASGFMSEGAMKYYNEVRLNSICELIKPHLTIYLDTPIQTWKDRSFKKSRYGEKNSPAFNDTYLSKLDSIFKTKFLPEMKKHGEVLQIDWSEEADDLEMDTVSFIL